MQCPECHYPKTYAKGTRTTKNTVIRIRFCPKCDEEQHTREVIITKKDYWKIDAVIKKEKRLGN